MAIKSDQGIRELKRTSGLTTPEKAVLSELHEHAGGTGECWPSVATICDGTGYSDRTIHKAIRQLEAKGLIAIQTRKAKSHLYQIRYPAIDRGCSPLEYNKPRPPQAAPRGLGEAEKIAIAAQSPEGIEKLAAFYQTSTTQVMIAIQRTRRRQPANFGAYLRRVLLENQRTPTLLEGRRETIMAARAELRALEAKGAVA